MLQSLYNGLSGLKASQLGVDISSDNIANANTEGFNKRIYETTSNPTITKYMNSIGTGVTDLPVTRSHDEILFSNMKRAMSNMFSDKSYKENIDSLNNSINERIDNSESFSNLINNMFYSLEKISEDPKNESLHESFKQNLQSVLDRKDYLNKEFDNYINNTNIKINDLENQAQELLNTFDQMSKDIAEYEAINTMTIDKKYLNDLRDKRDLVEEKLSQIGYFRVQKTNPGSGDINVSDTGNLIYSREFNDSSGELNGLKNFLNTLTEIKNTFNDRSNLLLTDLNTTYTEFGNQNLIENNKVVDTNLNFSKNNNDNIISLNMLSLQDNNYKIGDSLLNLSFIQIKANNKYSYTETVFEQRKNDHLKISQVNIDEEMVSLIKWKAAYDANAKVIQTADEILKTTINLKS